MELAYADLEGQRAKVQELKDYMKAQLQQAIPDVVFNGDTTPEKSLFTVLNAGLPASPNGEMLLFNLDIEGIAVSGGSACSSGSDIGSHVLNELLGDDSERINIRFSFSKHNTGEEIDYTVEQLKALL